MNNISESVLRAQLIELQTSPARRWSKRIASVLPEIEGALFFGASRLAVHRALQAAGIDISFSGFLSALYRLRRRARRQPVMAQSSPLEPRDAVSKPLDQIAPAQARGEPQSSAPGQRRHAATPSIAEIVRSEPNLSELRQLGRQHLEHMKTRASGDLTPSRLDKG